jgi:hypothetical protein
MLTPFFAQRFADSWYQAWNTREIERIMEHYAPHIEHSSPYLLRYSITDARSIIGRDHLRVFFERVLEVNKFMRLEALHVAVGCDSVALVYRGISNDLVAEVFFFDLSGKVVRSAANYGLWHANAPV